MTIEHIKSAVLRSLGHNEQSWCSNPEHFVCPERAGLAHFFRTVDDFRFCRYCDRSDSFIRGEVRRTIVELNNLQRSLQA